MSTNPILIDCDDVLADLCGACVLLMRDAGLDYPEVTHMRDDHLSNWRQPDFLCRLNPAVIERQFCYRLAELPGAIAWLRSLEREHGSDNVFVCTSPWNAEWTAQRAAWLERRGVPLKRQIQCSAKHLVMGRLVDDRPGVAATRPEGQTFCLTRPWNAASAEPVRGGYAEASAWLRSL